MTHLRQIMLEELERRNYAPGTIHCYIRTVEHYAHHFRCSPDQLRPRAYPPVSGSDVSQVEAGAEHSVATPCGSAFLLHPGVKRNWSVAETAYPKKVLHLPQVLSQAEVARLIDAALTPFHRTLLMTLYATGGRRAEVARLKISDIDSQRMVVHIRGGKGRKDRDVMLSPALLDALRVYWRELERKPSHWLFPGGHRHSGPKHALRYLGNYTHRVAISNHRLVALTDGGVTFRWRDSAHGNKKRRMTLPVDEFLRRFLLHLLPRGFVRLRNFGFLANRQRAHLLPPCFSLLQTAECIPLHPYRFHQTVLTHPGSVPCAAQPWMSWNGSPLLNSCSVPRHSMGTPHERTASPWNPPRARTRIQSLCLTRLRSLGESASSPLSAAQNKPPLRHPAAISTYTIHNAKPGNHPQPLSAIESP